MNCHVKFVFSWGRREQGTFISFLVASQCERACPRQMGPVRESTWGILSLGETSEVWALAHDQLYIKQISGVAQRSALRWFKG